MELDELKTSWKRSGVQIKSLSELELMTKIKHHPKLNRIRMKLIIEAILITILLVLYNNLFDGTDKPIWVNMLLVSSMSIHLMTGVYGYLLVKNPISGTNIKLSIEKFSSSLQRYSALSIGSALFFGLALILFFSSTISFTNEKYLILGGMIVTVILMTLFSLKNWLIKIKGVQEIISEFDD